MRAFNRSLAILAALILATTTALRAETPSTTTAAEQRAAIRTQLFAALGAAETEAEGRRIEGAIWQLWTTAPDPSAQALMDRALAARQTGDLEAALAASQALTEAYPAYPEGWNQVATLQFMLGQGDRSLETIHRVLELEPKHFGALSGRAIILMRQGRVRLSQKYLREAVAIHPWLRARRFLITAPSEDL
ncbi:MAG: hypothetical protein AAGD08_17755 [Pseudomonadota bacterium]